MKYEQNMNKEGKKTPGAYCVWLSAENIEDLVFAVTFVFL